MTPEEFDASFDAFERSVLRLEVHQTYAVSAEDSFAQAFRQGLPRPERSIRTSPWLRRVAATVMEGKAWTRIRLVRHPLTEYLRHELLAYVESAVVGEETRMVDLNRYPECSSLGPDFWLFDAGTPNEFAIVMHFDTAGAVRSYQRVYAVDWCVQQAEQALAKSISLAEYLARGSR